MLYSREILDLLETEIEQVHFVPILSGLGEDRTLRIKVFVFSVRSSAKNSLTKGGEKKMELIALIIGILLVLSGIRAANGETVVVFGKHEPFIDNINRRPLLGVLLFIAGVIIAIAPELLVILR